jgi:hypothetical protein
MGEYTKELAKLKAYIAERRELEKDQAMTIVRLSRQNKVLQGIVDNLAEEIDEAKKSQPTAWILMGMTTALLIGVIIGKLTA